MNTDLMKEIQPYHHYPDFEYLNTEFDTWIDYNSRFSAETMSFRESIWLLVELLMTLIWYSQQNKSDESIIEVQQGRPAQNILTLPHHSPDNEVPFSAN